MSGLGSKGRKKKGGGGGPGWILTYGDMVTLLLAFFVMLFAVSSVESAKFDAFISGLGQFGNPAADSYAGPANGPIVDQVPTVNPPVPSPAMNGPSSEVARDAEARLNELQETVTDAIIDAGLAEDVDVEADQRGVAIVINTDDVLFARGSAVVTPQGEEVISVLAPALRDIPNQILVEGHADNTPLDRNGYTNWNLSTDRAVAVVEELAGIYDLAAERLTASGFGEFRPRDPRDTAEARALNRRVVLVVVNEFALNDTQSEEFTDEEPSNSIGSDALPFFPGLPVG